MPTARKKYKASDVMNAPDTTEFDDLHVSELEDNVSDDDEVTSADVIVDGDLEVNLGDAQHGGGFATVRNSDACFKDSLLLNDIELQNVSCK